MLSNTPIAICELESDSLSILTPIAGQTYYWIDVSGPTPDTLFQGVDSSTINFGAGGFIIDGDFYCSVVGLNGCVTNSDTVNVQTQTVPQLAITPPNPIAPFCDGNSVFLTLVNGASVFNIKWFRDSLGVVTPYDTLLTNGMDQIFGRDSGLIYEISI